MNRCIDCNGLLTKEETVCIQCGAVVPGHAGKFEMKRAAIRFVHFLFFGSLGVTILGLFTDGGPSMLTRILITCALGMLRRSVREQPEERLAQR